ncbi:SEC-C domain-containing protein [Myxococcus xanthus]|uniref:SEC-C domain-containing protein n=1 Tax=Myxococcus xanthus TaxID=34 RepID=UPI00148C1A14|nr:SEC-C domain-containing protein [Myxococcus xanthus]NOJ86972.1 SEC-C domain-containing protein [Myxococcus xanthus]
MNLKTPEFINSAILGFSQELAGHNAQPTFVSVVTRKGAQALDCYMNAREYAAATGGEVLYGWQIWEWPGVLLEAQFHAIVKLPDGGLVDVTPPEDGGARVLFVHTPGHAYGGKMVPSRQRAIAASEVVDRYIFAFGQYTKFRAKHFVDDGGEDAGVELRSNRDRWRLKEFQIKFTEAHARLRRFSLNSPEVLPGPDVRCPCGSGEKVRKCHGPRSD